MSTARIKNPDKIVAELTFSMTLEDWKQVRQTLDSHTAYAEIQVINEINALVNQIEQVFYDK